jgi:hypothetical protein
LSCDRCPCPEICTGRRVWCDWAARDVQRPNEIRAICDRSQLDREAARHPQYPPALTQIRSAAAAATRAVTAAVTGKPVLVSAEERARRQAICDACPEYDATRGRCTKCGCGGVKLALATERCPLEPPKW